MEEVSPLQSTVVGNAHAVGTQVSSEGLVAGNKDVASFLRAVLQTWDDLPEPTREAIQTGAVELKEVIKPFYDDLIKSWDLMWNATKDWLPGGINFGFKVKSAYVSACKIEELNKKLINSEQFSQKLKSGGPGLFISSKDFDELNKCMASKEKLIKKMEQQALNCVKWSTIISGGIVLMEFATLYLAWQKIKHAKNISAECQMELPDIDKAISVLQEKSVKLQKYIDKCSGEEDSNPKTLRRLERLVNDMQFESSAVSRKIVILKMTVGQQITTIGATMQACRLRAATNLLNAAGTITQYISVGEHLSTPWLLALQTTTIAFLYAAVVNQHMYTISKETLSELSVIFEVVRGMEVNVEKINKIIKQAKIIIEEQDSDSE